MGRWSPLSTEIDFQNGFICGMATKGLIKGSRYEPIIWNDSGVYDYFYIDFKQRMSLFSLGMFKESIIVYDSEQIEVTAIEKVSAGVYKIFANIEGKDKGVTVINKAATLLSYLSGAKLPSFSVMFMVAGLDPIVRKAYAYDSDDIRDLYIPMISTEEIATIFPNYILINTIYETEVLTDLHINMNVTENTIISYWSV
jgi:hypothetical protein